MNAGQVPAILVLHGPNLNLLGIREPNIYGQVTLAELDQQICQWAQQLGIKADIYQSNHEGNLIDKIHECRHHYGALIINPAGFTHTSVAIYDALKAISLPAIEVHLSNLFVREDFRRKSVTGGACVGVIMGLGIHSYQLALQYLADVLTAKQIC